MNPYHNRLDMKLHSDDYSCPLCGSLNPRTKQAEYCSFDCPTLRSRMSRGEDVTKPVPPPES